MLMTRDKTKQTLVVAFIVIGLGAFGWANSHLSPLPIMPHHTAQGIYLPTVTPVTPTHEPLLP